MDLIRTFKGAAKGLTVSLTVIVVEDYNKPYFASMNATSKVPQMPGLYL